MNQNWHTWYLGGADSKFGLRFLKSRPKNPFMGKFGPKKSKKSVLPENRHTEYLDDADSYFDNPKLIFGQVWAEKVKAVCFA